MYSENEIALLVLIGFGYAFLFLYTALSVFSAFVIDPVDKGYVFIYDGKSDHDAAYVEDMKIDGRLTLFGLTGTYQAMQVNPACYDRKAFDRACWQMYGTGRRDYD